MTACVFLVYVQNIIPHNVLRDHSCNPTSYRRNISGQTFVHVVSAQHHWPRCYGNVSLMRDNVSYRWCGFCEQGLSGFWGVLCEDMEWYMFVLGIRHEWLFIYQKRFLFISKIYCKTHWGETANIVFSKMSSEWFEITRCKMRSPLKWW